MAIQPLRLDPTIVLDEQLVIELFDCVDQRFDDTQWIEESMFEAVRQASAATITSAFHKSSLIGISGVVMIAESYLVIHTWPEYGYAAADAFTCGDVLDGAQAVHVLSERLGSCRHLISSIGRGLGGHRLGLFSYSLVGDGPADEDSPTLRWTLSQGAGMVQWMRRSNVPRWPPT